MRLPSATHWVTLAVWAGVAGCAAFWAIRVFVNAPAMPPGATTVPTVQALQGDVSRLLGSAEVEPVEAAPVAAVPSRFKLIGVAAPRSPAAAGEGVALIVVDDKPPRAYRVGAAIDGDLVLQKVHARGVELGGRDAPASLSLTVPPLPPPATGVPMPRNSAGVPAAFPSSRPQIPTTRPLAPPQAVEVHEQTGEPETVDEAELPAAPTVRQGQLTQ